MASTSELDSYYALIMQLVDEAGQLISARNLQEKCVEEKSCNIDLVTETDQEVEKLLIEGIKKQFPNHEFIGEEDSSAGKKAVLTDVPTWIIDPVDGTMNFVHSFPHSAISVALLVNKVTEIGIVYNPVLEQKYTARRGQGAFYNGKQIKVSGEKKLSSALIVTEFGTSREEGKTKVVLENVNKLVPLVHGFRSLGSAALNICSVALGGADAYYEFGIHAWDYAAGEMIVREAGGYTCDPAGGTLDLMSRRCICAASKELADELVSQLIQFYPQPRDD